LLRLFSFLLLSCALYAPTAQAEPPRQVAVAALAGDSFLVNRYQTQTGTRISTNANERIALPGNGVNGILALMAEKEIKKVCSSCTAIMLGSNARISELQTKVVSGQTSIDSLIVPFLDAAKQAKASHLILITRQRGEVAPQFIEGKSGYGKVDGLGFFLDNTVAVNSVETGARAQGYMGLFSYLRFLLIDVVNERIVDDKFSRSNRVFANYENKGGSDRAWDTLSSEEKVEALERMARKDIEEIVPPLLAAAGIVK
jgi:hypothetical protein